MLSLVRLASESGIGHLSSEMHDTGLAGGNNTPDVVFDIWQC